MNGKRNIRPRFLSIEEKQAISEDVENLAKKYSLERIKLECSRYKMIYQARPKHTNADSLLVLTSYRPKNEDSRRDVLTKSGVGYSLCN